jgi:hypothetical protein
MMTPIRTDVTARHAARKGHRPPSQCDLAVAAASRIRLDIARSRDDNEYMLRLLERLLAGRRRSNAYYCVLRFPDSTESRWFSELPTPGTRIYSHPGFYFEQLWIVDEVLQSGRDTYTIFLVGRNEYLEHVRRSALYPDLGEELLELARHTRATVSDRRRRRNHRHYQL